MDMISTRQFRALLGALALLGAFASQAGAAPLMTYQGRLKESGVPVSGPKIIDIQLCTALTGGLCTTSGQQGVMVSSGLFRTTFTLPSNVDLIASQQWFLEVRVGGGPVVTLTPREELTVGPYAVYASSASGLAVASGVTGVSVSTSMFITGKVGINTNTPTLNLSLGKFTNQTFGVEDEGAGGFGKNLDIVSGSAGIGGGNGGALKLAAGFANGGGINNGGSIILQAGDKVGAGGIMGAVEISGSSTAASAAHLRTTQTTPPAVGGNGFCNVNAANAVGSDTAGIVTFSPAAGGGTAACVLTVTFNRAYLTIPKLVMLTPALIISAAPGGGLSAYVDSAATTTASFQIKMFNVTAAFNNYAWYYLVIE